MQRNVIAALAAFIAVPGALVLVTGPGSATASPQAQNVVDRGPFKPVADLEMLMEAQGAHLEGIEGALKSGGDKAMKSVRFHAEVLAELANVNRYHKDKADYVGWATQLRDTAMELARKADDAAGADAASLAPLVTKLKDTCTACHDVYD